MILGPVANRLGTKRLLVVADGALQFVPFAALPKPGGGGPVIAAHEVTHLPSAAALVLLRSETLHRPLPPSRVAVIADPVFDKDDARLAVRVKKQPRSLVSKGLTAATEERRSASSDEGRILRAARAAGLTDDEFRFPRLVLTRHEANDIARLAGPGQVMKAIDFKASRATVMSPEIGNYRILHFATHGLLDAESPELSALVLSLVDEGGEIQNGFLRLHEIYDLNLRADLVVLSACQTGLGKEIKGEGIIGLTRGFMYAGARRVVASLWKVDDDATAELMKLFYEGMLKRGESPSAALRAAQLAVRKQPQWRSPFFWAAFTLQGEYR
jgi:CHAT domain-containing protein